MSLFTVAECDENIAALKCHILANPMSSIGSVSIGSRNIAYKSAQELEAIVLFWERQRNQAVQAAAGRYGPSISVARWA